MAPDFLGIGAAKAGTGWLYNNLRKLPEIWLPPFKELHYFDELNDPLPMILPFFNKSGRRLLKRRFVKKFYFKKDVNHKWYFRYFFHLRNDSWYTSLFTPESYQLCGEITPRYGIINENAISRVKLIAPNLKLIYALRNPVDRSLSHIRMTLEKKRNAFIRHEVLNIELDLQGDYVNNYKRWLKYFSKDQILLVYFDELIKNPAKYFQDITNFIGIKQPFIMDNLDLQSRHNSTSYSIPDEIKISIGKRLFPMIKKQHSYFDNEFTATWLEETARLVK